MPDTKISALTDGGAIQDTDELVVARGSANNKITGDKLKNKLDIASLTATTGIVGSDLMVMETSGGDLRKAQVGTDMINKFYAPSTMPAETSLQDADVISLERSGALKHATLATLSLFIGGGFSVTTISTSPHLAAFNEVVSANAATTPIIVNLPVAAGNNGKRIVVKKVDSTANAVTLMPDGSETIDNSVSKALSTQFESVTIISDGTNWIII